MAKVKFGPVFDGKRLDPSITISREIETDNCTICFSMSMEASLSSGTIEACAKVRMCAPEARNCENTEIFT